MTRSRPITLLAGAALLPLGTLGVAACGGGNTATAASHHSKPAAHPASTHTTTVGVATTGLGRVLVDSRGRTLYLFTKDSGTTSACSGACATAWPPLRGGGKTAVQGAANASLVGTTKRSGGAAQATYNGHPLYTFVMDAKRGDTHGEGVTAFGGSWFAVSPAGKRVHKPSAKAAPAPASTPAPTSTPAPASTPAPTSTPAPASTPTPKPPAASNGIPQNNGGDHDSDNNGGPSDGDGGI
jgi:predicted lipoprotein with Yx(FWY)xxD motif